MELIKPIEKLLDLQYVANELEGRNPNIEVHIGMNNKRGDLWQVFGNDICEKVLGMVPDPPLPPGITTELPPYPDDTLHAKSEENLREVDAKLKERLATLT